MKDSNLISWVPFVEIITVLTLMAGLALFPLTVDAGTNQRNSISAVGASKTGNGLGVSITTPAFDFGEVRWTANGKRTKVEERRYYEESNHFSLQGILYPNFLSMEGLGMQLRGGIGLKGYGSSNYKESWNSGQYFEESNVEGGVYLLGSIQASISLNLTKGIEAFSLTKSGTPEPSPVWSLLNPLYVVFSFQGGPGWTTEAANFRYKSQGRIGLEYRCRF